MPSAAQKTAAERIAIEKASTGYTVRNELSCTIAQGFGILSVALIIALPLAT